MRFAIQFIFALLVLPPSSAQDPHRAIVWQDYREGTKLQSEALINRAEDALKDSDQWQLVDSDQWNTTGLESLNPQWFGDITKAKDLGADWVVYFNVIEGFGLKSYVTYTHEPLEIEHQFVWTQGPMPSRMVKNLADNFPKMLDQAIHQLGIKKRKAKLDAAKSFEDLAKTPGGIDRALDLAKRKELEFWETYRDLLTDPKTLNGAAIGGHLLTQLGKKEEAL
ncbi:MAG: hypothetical protein AAF226_09175, partial [Verrucomicrobiota bacterium]